MLSGNPRGSEFMLDLWRWMLSGRREAMDVDDERMVIRTLHAVASLSVDTPVRFRLRPAERTYEFPSQLSVIDIAQTFLVHTGSGRPHFSLDSAVRIIARARDASFAEHRRLTEWVRALLELQCPGGDSVDPKLVRAALFHWHRTGPPKPPPWMRARNPRYESKWICVAHILNEIVEKPVPALSAAASRRADAVAESGTRAIPIDRDNLRVARWAGGRKEAWKKMVRSPPEVASTSPTKLFLTK